MKLTHTILCLAAPAAALAQWQGPSEITVGTVHIKGLPRDWSHRHLLFSNPGTEADATKAGTHDRWLKIVNDPRYVIQQLQRQQPGQGPAAAQVASLLAAKPSPASPASTAGDTSDTKRKHRDWSMDLGAGSIPANTFPAKWSFDTTTANCTSDFVIFATGAAGSSTQATIVAYNNLYAGCGGTVPSAYWSYNTSNDAINSLSPVFSADGSQVAFVQNSGGVSSLVLLKWAANSSLLSLSTTPGCVLPELHGALHGGACCPSRAAAWTATPRLTTITPTTSPMSATMTAPCINSPVFSTAPRPKTPPAPGRRSPARSRGARPAPVPGHPPCGISSSERLFQSARVPYSAKARR